MDFTGERFTPDCVREIWYEHWHRYAFALQFVAGKSVLDLACGEGYGSHLLATSASQVIGMDLSQEAVAHASKTYQHPNLSYQQGSASAIPLADGTMDTVVSFETLEHLLEQEQMLAEFRRVLKPNGVLLISTPDKKTYSDEAGFDNQFHLKELYLDEFKSLLSDYFPAMRLYGQKLLFQSVIWDPEQPNDQSTTAAATTMAETTLEQRLGYSPMYYIAVAAAELVMLPRSIPSMHLFGDQAESVYQHYNHEIKKNIEAGGILAERDGELAALRQRTSGASFWRRLFGSKRT